MSAGMVMAAHMSHEMGWIDMDILDRTVSLLPAGMREEDFLSLMAVDKKVANGKLKLVLLRGSLGKCVVTSDFHQQALLDTLTHFCRQPDHRSQQHRTAAG